VIRALWSLPFLALTLFAQDGIRPANDLSADIDRWIEAAGKPGEAATDHEFCRRVHLDLLGRLPSAADARSFAADTAPGKRSTLINRLLEDARFAEFWSEVWVRTLVGFDLTSLFRQELDLHKLREWLQEQFSKNRSLDELAKELLTAGGELKDNGPVHFMLFYIKPMAREPIEASVAVARVFLGYRLQCAQCHDHPFDRWTQEDFWGWTAFLARTRQVTRNTFDGVRVTFGDRPRGELTRDGKEVAPRFLDGTAPPADAPSRREALAKWIVSQRQFARAMVNRVWAHCFGRGLVEPVDGFGGSNPGAPPELLEKLAETFKRSGFDFKALIRGIVRSRAYQRSSAGSPDGFAHQRVRPLHPVALFNALIHALNAEAFVKTEEFQKAKYLFLYVIQSLLGQQGGPDEARYQGNVQQALVFMNNKDFNNGLAAPTGLPAQIVREHRTAERRVEELFLALLGRPPSEAELKRHVEYARLRKSELPAFVDIAWVLMNTNEFFFNH